MTQIRHLFANSLPKPIARPVSIIATFLVAGFMLAVATAIYFNNALGTVDQKFFTTFQEDSQALVVGNLVVNRDDHPLRNRANLWITGAPGGPPVNELSYEFLRTGSTKYEAIPYTSQFGIQGWFYGSLYRKLGLKSIEGLNFLCALLTAVTVVALSWSFVQALPSFFGPVFYISMVGSPWIASFGRNLFWSPFLWFLPMLVATRLYLKKPSRIAPYLLLLFCAVFMKSLAGYEYISSVIWLACSIFILDAFLPSPRWGRVAALKMTSVLFAVCVLGFLGAILVHALQRSENLTDGLLAIWSDVQRRTYADPHSFDSSLQASLVASPMDVLKKYILEWHTPILFSISGRYFANMLVSAGMIISLGYLKQHSHRHRDLGLVLAFVGGPLSWFVLAKSHSYIHTHMNYVLWYFGFVAAILFIHLSAFDSIVAALMTYFQKRRRRLESAVSADSLRSKASVQ